MVGRIISRGGFRNPNFLYKIFAPGTEQEQQQRKVPEGLPDIVVDESRVEDRMHDLKLFNKVVREIKMNGKLTSEARQLELNARLGLELVLTFSNMDFCEMLINLHA